MDGRSIIASKPLKYFDNMFSDDTRFFRVSKSYLINTDYIEFYNKNKETIMLKNGSEIEISRRKKKAFLDALNVI